jgi:putative tricarboxylic transport membrane protein
MLSRRDFLYASAATGALGALDVRTALAQALDQVQIMVPAAPGGGWDQTGRLMEQVLRSEKLAGSVQITNVAGAGGTVGLPQFVNQWRTRPNALMVGGLVMVGAIIANKSPVKLNQTTPIARLTGEYMVVVVPAGSSIKTVGDLASALKADPKKVSVAGGSAGGSDHILFGMMGKALGVAPQNLNYVAYSGGGQAQAALLGSHVTAGISGYGEFAEQVKAGKLRAIGISSPTRVQGIEVPTLKEQGVDVDFANWRGVFAPPGIAADRKQALVSAVEKMANSAAWQEECKKRDWTPIYLGGDEFAKFLEQDIARTEAILKDLGLAS